MIIKPLKKHLLKINPPFRSTLSGPLVNSFQELFKGDSGHPGYGLSQVINAIPIRASAGSWRRSGNEVIMILDESEDVSGCLLGSVNS